jgi:hypothetical protein
VDPRLELISALRELGATKIALRGPDYLEVIFSPMTTEERNSKPAQVQSLEEYTEEFVREALASVQPPFPDEAIG